MHSLAQAASPHHEKEAKIRTLFSRFFRACVFFKKKLECVSPGTRLRWTFKRIAPKKKNV